MPRLFAKPVWAPFFAFFGIVLIQLGHEASVRGFVTYVPEQGPQEILSSTHRPAIYCALNSGMIIVGILCLTTRSQSGCMPALAGGLRGSQSVSLFPGEWIGTAPKPLNSIPSYYVKVFYSRVPAQPGAGR